MNLQTTIHLDVDFYDKKYILINAKQYDDSSRWISISCYNQGKAFALNTNEHTVYIRYRKADENGVLNSCRINYKGEVLVELTEQMLAADGICYADLIIVGKGNAIVNIDTGEIIAIDNSPILSTMAFCVNVYESAIDNSVIESSYEYNGLNEALQKADAEYTEIIQLAKSYAIGDAGGIRENENTDNSKYYYQLAFESANSAVESSANALESENNALVSEQNALTYMNNAKTSETNASVSEENAKTYMESALVSEQNAKTSEQNAKTSEQNALTSEQNALTYMNNTEDYKNETYNYSVTSQRYAIGGTGTASGEDTDNAKYYYEQSLESADNADVSEANALESANNASLSASSASDSAASASSSAASASKSEASASASATNASASEVAAKGYATTAQNSMNFAIDSATSASESATNAYNYYLQVEDITTELGGAFLPMGTVEYAELATLLENGKVESGHLYTISDNFVTDETFKKGAGVEYTAGTNVYYTGDGYWDCLVGTIVTGVKGDNETYYRKGNVNITAENIGAISSTDIAIVDDVKNYLGI